MLIQRILWDPFKRDSSKFEFNQQQFKKEKEEAGEMRNIPSISEEEQEKLAWRGIRLESYSW